MTRAAPIAAAMLVAACASLAPAPVPLDGLPQSFEMSGRMSVSQGGRGEIFRIRWNRTPRAGTWVLATPIGTEVARIEREGDELTVYRPGEPPVSSSSFSELTQSLLGAALDERQLVAWLHGRPVAGPGDWAVTIDEPRGAGTGDAARRITATRGNVVVKLVVDEYRVPKG